MSSDSILSHIENYQYTRSKELFSNLIRHMFSLLTKQNPTCSVDGLSSLTTAVFFLLSYAENRTRGNKIVQCSESYVSMLNKYLEDENFPSMLNENLILVKRSLEYLHAFNNSDIEWKIIDKLLVHFTLLRQQQQLKRSIATSPFPVPHRLFRHTPPSSSSDHLFQSPTNSKNKKKYKKRKKNKKRSKTYTSSSSSSSRSSSPVVIKHKRNLKQILQKRVLELIGIRENEIINILSEAGDEEDLYNFAISRVDRFVQTRTSKLKSEMDMFKEIVHTIMNALRVREESNVQEKFEETIKFVNDVIAMFDTTSSANDLSQIFEILSRLKATVSELKKRFRVPDNIVDNIDALLKLTDNAFFEDVLLELNSLQYDFKITHETFSLANITSKLISFKNCEHVKQELEDLKLANLNMSLTFEPINRLIEHENISLNDIVSFITDLVKSKASSESSNTFFTRVLKNLLHTDRLQTEYNNLKLKNDNLVKQNNELDTELARRIDFDKEQAKYHEKFVICNQINEELKSEISDLEDKIIGLEQKISHYEDMFVLAQESIRVNELQISELKRELGGNK